LCSDESISIEEIKNNFGTSSSAVKFASARQEAWNFWKTELEKLQPVDIGVLVGDLTSGKQQRQGGFELLSIDPYDQISMAAAIASEIHPKQGFLILRGTEYHCGTEEHYENLVAGLLQQPNGSKHYVKISDHQQADIEGKIFDFKHHISASKGIYGPATGLTKEKLFNLLWSEIDGTRRADYLIRAHLHQFFAVTDLGSNGKLRTAMTLPGLEFWSRYGVSRCSGIIHLGFVVFDFLDDGSVQFYPKTAQLQTCKRKIIKM